MSENNIKHDEVKIRTPLGVALVSGDPDMVELLLNSSDIDGNLVDEQGRSLLHYISLLELTERSAEMVKMAQLLVGSGHFPLDHRDKYGLTPLALAACQGNATNVKLLLETGKVDVRAMDLDGWTPFDLAVFHRSCRVVEVLMELSDIDIQAPSPVGGPALMVAAANRHLKTLEVLLAPKVRRLMQKTTKVAPLYN